MEQPVWKPGEAVPAEPLGAGFVVSEAQTKTPTAPPIPRAPISAPAPKPVPRPSRGGGGPSERPPWLIPAAVAVAIVLLLGIFGVIVLANRSANPTGQVHTTPSAHPSGSATTKPSTKPSASPTGNAPRAVPSFGPASADPVKSVQICTTASPCSIPGSNPETGSNCDLASCKLEVALYFTAVQKSTQVSYTVKFFNRCTGDTIDLPGASTTTPASGYIVAIPTDHLSVSIPSGVKSGAIVAVSANPAVAASAPLLLGSDTSCS